MSYPENITEFMNWVKVESEKFFETIKLESDVAGWQHQKGTKWRKGLNDGELRAFQDEVGFNFPDELVTFYKTMNGTTIPGINVYAEPNSKPSFRPIYFSYPEHIDIIKKLIDDVLKIPGLAIESMKEKKIPYIFPISYFYFMIVDNESNPIYYMSTCNKDHDIAQQYIYCSLEAESLQSFLVKNTFYQTTNINDLEEFPNKPRLSNYWLEQSDRHQQDDK